jgi:beta-glucosidase
MDGDEVVQAYIQYPDLERMPVKELRAFKRVTVSRNGSRELTFSIPMTELQKWDLLNKNWKLYKGTYKIILGSHSRDEKLSASFTVQ